jgi:hypothetical protein
MSATGMPTASTGTIDEYWLHTPTAPTTAASARWAAHTSPTAASTASNRARGSCVTASPLREVVSGRLAVPATVPSDRTNATFTLVVPTSIPKADTGPAGAMASG